MNKRLVSIIIPCYNDENFIFQSVESALNQSYPHKEVIVVDDGSNKETKKVLKDIKPLVSKLITQENKGQSAARNTGIKAAKGEYIFVLDSDDYAEPTFCEKAMHRFLKNTETKIVSCHATLIYEDKPSEIYMPQGGTVKHFIFKNAALGTSIFKKKDWNLAGGYDEAMKIGWEDWEFFIRLLKHSGKAVIINESLYNYRKRNQSTTSIANKTRYNLYAYIINKHKDLYIQHFDGTISFLLHLAEESKKNELKRINSLDYRLGHLILKPLRFLKKVVL